MVVKSSANGRNQPNQSQQQQQHHGGGGGGGNKNQYHGGTPRKGGGQRHDRGNGHATPTDREQGRQQQQKSAAQHQQHSQSQPCKQQPALFGCPPQEVMKPITIMKRHSIKDFPLTVGTHMLEGGFELKLNYLEKPEAIYISLRKGEVAQSSLLFKKSKDLEIRAAAIELGENVRARGAKGVTRDPICQSSLAFLKKYSITELSKALDSFPEATYYCQLCDYHINNIAHAKVHLDPNEDPRHSDTMTRIAMRERLCSSIPKPVKNQLAAIDSSLQPIYKYPTDSTDSCLLFYSNYLRGSLQEMFTEGLNRILDDEEQTTVAGASEKTSEADDAAEEAVKEASDCLQEQVESAIEPKAASQGEDKKPSVREAKLELFGSVLVGCDLEDSDINFCLDVPGVSDADAMNVIWAIYEMLRDFQRNNLGTEEGDIVLGDGNFPRISMTINGPQDRRVKVVVIWRHFDHVKHSRLLSLYVHIQPKLAPLLRAVRKWAQICKIFGPPGLHKHAFDLMLIHFLQQRNKITILHEVFKVEPNDLLTVEFCEKVKSHVGVDTIRPFDIAELFVEFFRHYSTERNEVVQITQHKAIQRQDTKWNNKVFQIQDPIRNENIVNFTKAFQPYFFNCILQTFKYLAIPRNADGPLIGVKFYQQAKESSRKKKKDRDAAKDKEKQTPKTPGAPPGYQDEKPSSETPILTAETPKRMAELEERLQAQGKTPKEDPEQFLMKKVEEAVSESSKKRKRMRKKKSKEGEEEEEVVEQSATVEDFVKIQEIAPHLEIDGIPILKLKPEDVEIDDTMQLQYSRRAMLRLKRFTTPAHVTDEMKKAVSLLKLEPGCSFVNNDYYEDTKLTDSDTPMKSARRVIPVDTVQADSPKKDTDEMARFFAKAHQIAATSIPLGNDSTAEVLSTQRLEIIRAAQKKINKEETGEDEATATLTAKMNSLTIKKEDWTVEEPEAPASELIPEEIVLPVEQPAEEAAAEEQPAEPLDKVCFEDFFIEFPEPFDLKILDQVRSWKIEDFLYTLEEENFTAGFVPDMKCSHCDSPKHLSDDCPQMKIPELETITYERSKLEWDELNEIVTWYYKEAKVDDKRRDQIMKRVGEFAKQLEKQLGDGARLEVFGSLRNGFGGANSDADICFRFEPDIAPEGKEDKEVIRTIGEILRKFGVYSQCILGAKVPIVKFKTVRPVEFEGDISYYNTLALSNTEMLATYCKWEPERLPQLGLWVKKWAKECDIGDASKGSLSSYSYIIMTIHYLQNCEPPVLPRLQEDFRTSSTESQMNGQWDVYFHKEVPQERWSKNEKTVAELFVGFLDYFSRFDYKAQVIQIRRKKPLSRMEKKWNRSINLEDPFDLSHNLGSGVTHKMFVYILKSFRKSRSVFMKPDTRDKVMPKGTPKNQFVTNGFFLSDYRNALLKDCSAGKAPSDRQCHYCHKVGHFYDNCPQRLQREEARLIRENNRRNGNNNGRRGDGDRDRKDGGGGGGGYGREFNNRRGGNGGGGNGNGNGGGGRGRWSNSNGYHQSNNAQNGWERRHEAGKERFGDLPESPGGFKMNANEFPDMC